MTQERIDELKLTAIHAMMMEMTEDEYHEFIDELEDLSKDKTFMHDVLGESSTEFFKSIIKKS